MIVGIDIGGSTTDAVLLDAEVRVVSVEANDPVAAAAGALGKLVSDLRHRLSDVSTIAATGGGARLLGDELLGVPVRKVAEITAIGVGGSTLAGKREALVVSMGTGILFGLIPALQGSRADLSATLKESAGRVGTGFRQNKARSLLVVTEIALALILLIGSALLIRTTLALRAANDLKPTRSRRRKNKLLEVCQPRATPGRPIRRRVAPRTPL